jgi:D-sedoheptulose 7-phosphate isomerase
MKDYLKGLIDRFPELIEIQDTIVSSYEIIRNCYQNGGTLFVCGNGGSAADAEHIVGELMKGFMLKRPIDDKLKNKLADRFGKNGKFIGDNLQDGLRTVSLTGHPALSTAFANDVESSLIFAQQLHVLGRPGDVLLALSTSGNSENVLRCIELAQVKDIKTVLFTGASGGKCAEIADISVTVPAESSFEVQEYHLPIYHALCMMLENYFYKS